MGAVPGALSNRTLQTGQEPLLADATRTFFSVLAPVGDGEIDAIGRLRSLGSQVAMVMAGHSYLIGDDGSRAARELFRLDDEEVDAAWDGLRGEYVRRAIVLTTVIAVADPPLRGAMAEVAIRVGFGLDSVSRVCSARSASSGGRRGLYPD